MDVKEAVTQAKGYAADFLSDESISEFQLEEVVYDHQEGIWSITIGYYVNDTKPVSGLVAQMETLHGGKRVERKYKVFEIMDKSGAFVAMKIRKGNE